MKKLNTDVRDIYRSTDPQPPPPAAQDRFEMVERELRRQRIFNLTVGVLSLGLVFFLTTSIVKDYVIASGRPTEAARKAPVLTSYTLSPDEQWAVEYRQIAAQAESGEAPGPKELSTKWLKNTAYHIIMGEQALRNDDLAAAKYHFEKAQETFPEMTGIQRSLGTVYLKLQDFKRAEALLKQAQTETPPVELLNNLGAACLGLEDYAQAEALFRQALQIRPETAGCYRNLALLYQKTGRTEDAVSAFERYFSLNPADTALLERYAAYLTGTGRVRDLIRFLDGLEGADPLAARLLLAKAAAQDGDAERSLRALSEASRFLSPRQMIAELHDAAFEPLARTEPFEALMDQLELAAVSLSTNLNVAAPQP